MDNREIDALIAEKIFNWNWRKVSEERKMLVPPLEDKRSMWTGMWDQTGIPHYTPKYSTNITDAWEIVDKLKQEDQYYFRLENGDLKDYGCIFSNFNDNYYAEADTSPLAICKAALKSQGIII